MKNKISPTDESYKLFFDIIDEIHTEYTEKKAGYEFKIRALKNEFLSCVVRVSDYKIVNSTKNMNLLNDINKIIEEKYAERIALESIAELCHMSKYHFSHTFKRLTGMSFISYLTLFRTEKAAVLLRYTNKSMSDIAYECGFGNVRSFNRSFKETLNLTPLQYRAAAKKT